MTLRTYDKRLLEFIYRLTLQQKLMNPREIAEYITVQGKQISERTIKRWLKFLRENYYFAYYPSVKCTKLGLVNAMLFLNNVAADGILEIIPYKAYFMFGTDLKNLEKCYFVHYTIPKNNLKDFERFWKLAVDRGLVKAYTLFIADKIIATYSPFHKIVAVDGNLNFDHYFNNDYFLNLLNQKIYSKREKIEQNFDPFLMPILIEYFKDTTSSRKAWFNIKAKLGEDVWDYIEDNKIKKKKTNGVGVNYIQRILRDLQARFDEFFYQIRISYGPLYCKDKINLLILLNLENKIKLNELVRELSQNALYTVTCYSENKGVLLDLLTSHAKIHKIFNIILSRRAYGKAEKMVWANYEKSRSYWSTENWLKSKYHELFDPKTKSWIFDSQKYCSELLKLSRNFFKKKQKIIDLCGR